MQWRYQWSSQNACISGKGIFFVNTSSLTLPASCRDCILAHLSSCEDRGEQPRCPTCSHGPVKVRLNNIILYTALFFSVLILQPSDLLEVVRRKKGTDILSSSQDSQPEVTLRRNDFHSSTKLEALVRDLRKWRILLGALGLILIFILERLRDQDPCFRAVVFSQFTSFLDLIQIALEREHFEQYRFDGSMDIKKKNAAVTEFKSPSRKPKVLVISLKAGGVGLNVGSFA